MPTRIERALDFPIVAEVVKSAGEETVQAYIYFELMQLAHLVSVGGNLNPAQCEFIARELINLYPNETIADFKLCFQRGAIGQYNIAGEKDIFRLDGIVIRRWMEKYLEEKYEIKVKEMYKERDELYKPAPQTFSEEVQEQKIKDRLKEWRETVLQENIKQVPDLTEKQIREEGKEKPKKAATWDNGLSAADIHNKMVLHRAASEFYKGRTSFATLKTFVVDGYEIMAESENDAREIYKSAK